MARQNNTEVQFGKTTRRDEAVIMSSGRAGVVQPVTYIPLLRGDSASGSFGLDVELAEMPRPLLNAVTLNCQAWFVPKTAFPQFSGMDDFRASYQGKEISALGQAVRAVIDFFHVPLAADRFKMKNSTLLTKMGIHLNNADFANTDIVDAFWLIHNFRLAAHSSRLPLHGYFQDDADEAGELPRAFWPSGRFSRVVPDYERALVVGELDLDVAAGRIPVSGIGFVDGYESSFTPKPGGVAVTGGTVTTDGDWTYSNADKANPMLLEDDANPGFPAVYAEMTGQSIGVTLADIDAARRTQAFAKLRTAYAGQDHTGYIDDDMLTAEYMQGFAVPEMEMQRPWLLDSKRVSFGMVEKSASDWGNLDKSLSQGRASCNLSINVPANDAGGIIMVVIEVLPERLYERQSDEFLHCTEVAHLPNALRDVQNPEPVDLVLNRRLDTAHTTGSAAYGWEPQNDKWNRSFTRLGGDFYQADPSNPWTEQRSAIWQTEIVDPELTEDHWLAPADFPHDPFSDTQADAFELVARHNVTIRGITQIGDVLAESNDDYAAVTGVTNDET